jgi:hypothetical protein
MINFCRKPIVYYHLKHISHKYFINLTNLTIISQPITKPYNFPNELRPNLQSKTRYETF